VLTHKHLLFCLSLSSTSILKVSASYNIHGGAEQHHLKLRFTAGHFSVLKPSGNFQV